MNYKEDNLPLVSIVIPTYNNATYIADAVKSVMVQDYPNLEIIIIDDASADNTVEVIAEFTKDLRVKYIRNNENMGRVATYHKGLYDLAKGEWYLNLDGDDYLTDPSFISKAISWINTYPDVVMVTGACERLVNGKLHYTISNKYDGELNNIDGKTFFLDLPSEKASFIHLATLYNRTRALALNFYSQNIISTDFESLFRLALKGNIITYNKVVGVWRIHGNNESFLKSFAINEIIKNFKFIENSVLFGVTFLPKEKLKNWRKEYLIKIIEGYILQVLIRKPGNSFVIIMRLFLNYPLFFVQACIKIIKRKARKLITLI